MGTITPIWRDSFRVEVNVIPAGFAGALERRGLARRARVVDCGLEMEPIASERAILDACRAAGLRVLGTSSTRLPGRDWTCGLRPAGGAVLRLTSRHSSVWLPTFPAA